jgi:hypothetical protein
MAWRHSADYYRGSNAGHDAGYNAGKPAAQEAATEPAAGLPPEYRTLAMQLAQHVKTDPRAFRDDKSMVEVIAEGHAAVMDLRRIKSTDADITYIASLGTEAFSDAVNRMERINSLPKPPDVGSLMVESFIHGLYGNVYAGYALGADADNKQKAIAVEVQGLVGAIEKADAARLLLPKVAMKYAAPVSKAPGRIVADFDESWGAWGPYDWLFLSNTGAELEDCTVVVELTGANGDVHKNVHYLRNWQGGGWVCARYDPGRQFLGRPVGRMTVSNVQTVDVAVYSPRFSTKLHYDYQGPEKDNDFAKRCKGMTLRWRYQPFEQGVLWNTDRGVLLTLDGIPFVPKCRVDVTFKKGGTSKAWYWEFDFWTKGEQKTFASRELTFDPEEIEVVMSFPGTNYRHRWVLKTNR